MGKLLCLCLLWLSFFPPHVFAATQQGTLEVSPAFVEVTIQSSQQSEQVPLTFQNHSQKTVNLDLFPIDFRQKDENGALSFLEGDSGYSYSLSSFLSFETNTLILSPGEKRKVLITVQNRQDLSPGGHYAAVIAKIHADDTQSQGSVISPSLSSLILVKKTGGERYNLSLKSVEFPNGFLAFSFPQSMRLLFQNEGNIHLVPYGRIEIRDMWGRLLEQGIINPQSSRVFPSSRRYIYAEMTPLTFSLPVSFNTLQVKGIDSLNKVPYEYTTEYLYVNPYVLGGIVLLVGIGIWWWRKRKHAKGRGHSA